MAAVSNRYARAFVDVVFNTKMDAARTVEQLRTFVAMFESSSELRRVWESPAITADQKRKLLDSLVAHSGDVPRQLRNFLAVLIDHSRIAMLPEIAKQFETELNTRMGIVEAEVSSARQLNDTERAALVAELSRSTGQRVAARYKVDHSLLGGAVVRVGSTVYDGSVLGQLQKIKQELAGE